MNIDHEVNVLLSEDDRARAAPGNFRILFKYSPGSDITKLSDRIARRLGVRTTETAHDLYLHNGVLYLKGVYPKEKIRLLARKLSGSFGVGLPTGSIYVDRWNPVTQKFHLVGTLKDFRGYYDAL